MKQIIGVEKNLAWMIFLYRLFGEGKNYFLNTML